MNTESKAFLLSLAAHSAAIWFACVMASSLVHLRKPVVIDFTLVDSASTVPVGEGKVRPTAKVKENKREIPATTPQAAKPMPAQAQIDQPAKSTPTEAVSYTATPSSSAIVPSGSGPILVVDGGQGAGAGRVTAPSKTLSPGNGTGNGSEQLKGRYLKENFTYIRDLIQKNLAYPARARKMGWTGKVVVSFTVLEDGHVADERIIAGSGHDLLDDIVIETIRNVEPFPKPPVKAELRIPIYYRLE